MCIIEIESSNICMFAMNSKYKFYTINLVKMVDKIYWIIIIAKHVFHRNRIEVYTS